MLGRSMLQIHFKIFRYWALKLLYFLYVDIYILSSDTQ